MNTQRLRRFSSSFLFFAITATLVNVAIGEDTYHLTVVTDRADAVYETRQRAKFLVTVTKGETPVTEGRVSYVIDDFITQFPPSNDYPRRGLDFYVAVSHFERRTTSKYKRPLRPVFRH